MVLLTVDDIEKLQLFDKLFSSMKVEEIQTMLTEEMVVAKLRNEPVKTGLLYPLYTDNISMSTELSNLQHRIQRLESDLDRLIRCLNNGPYSSNAKSEFDTLKISRSIY